MIAIGAEVSHCTNGNVQAVIKFCINVAKSVHSAQLAVFTITCPAVHHDGSQDISHHSLPLAVFFNACQTVHHDG